jgi:hypothetical protein
MGIRCVVRLLKLQTDSAGPVLFMSLPSSSLPPKNSLLGKNIMPIGIFAVKLTKKAFYLCEFP